MKSLNKARQHRAGLDTKSYAFRVAAKGIRLQLWN